VEVEKPIASTGKIGNPQGDVEESTLAIKSSELHPYFPDNLSPYNEPVQDAWELQFYARPKTDTKRSSPTFR
jgi:hypothetical protein